MSHSKSRMGVDYETLLGRAAVVSGGIGIVTGSMLGGMIQGVLANGRTLNSVGIDIQMTIKGLVLLLAVAFDAWSKSRK